MYVYVYLLYTFVHIYTQPMTNILKQNPQKKVQTHIRKAYEFLDEHLPYEYAAQVVEELKKKGILVSSSVVRNVRTAKTTTNRDVLNALLLVAKKNKKLLDEIQINLND